MNPKNLDIQTLTTFIKESNFIENERDEQAHWDCMKAFWLGRFQDQSGIDISHIILTVHFLAMANKNKKIAGQLRRCNVRVGNYKAPSYKEVEGLLEDWCKKYGKAKSAKKIKEAHVEFEKIHPFEDGNGRVGRIIYNLQRCRAGLPIHVIYEAEKNQYYSWFQTGKKQE